VRGLSALKGQADLFRQKEMIVRAARDLDLNFMGHAALRSPRKVGTRGAIQRLTWTLGLSRFAMVWEMIRYIVFVRAGRMSKEKNP
jgi:hypothetical protein